MTSNNPAKRVLEICDHVLRLSRAERAAYLERICGSDEETRLQVESLLAAIDDSGSFLIIDDPHKNDKE